MPGLATISVAQLLRLVGTPDVPIIIDVRIADDVAFDPRVMPGAVAHDYRAVVSWAPRYAGKSVAVVCQRGLKLSQGVAAWLRHAGASAESLDGGFEAWAAERGPLVKTAVLPARDPEGRTVWVTRARPKIDRIACPWLIRRFVDPQAVFLFVAASEVQAVAEQFSATPFDIEAVFWSHRGELCTFDVMLEAFGLQSAPLLRLAQIVRGADTSRADLAPEAAGLLAASLGLSRMYRDDLAQLDAAMVLYDAFYRWARDATGETHNWPSLATGSRA
jgi:rhodanese-related sulfurtransferase